MQPTTQNRHLKWFFFLLGTICLVLAYIGILLPGIPGTPFILLTAYFYIRSSQRLYNWLLRQKLFRLVIEQFENKTHLSLRLKISILIPFLISIIVAEIILIKTLLWGMIIGLVSLVLVIIVLWFQPKQSKDTEQ
jgi:uncharacterized protein